MKIVTAEFIRSCVDPAQFPPGDFREIAVVGRSNVGKSSLINSLLNRRDLAKVSRTPGKTRAVNLFRVATSDPDLAQFYLVDLPGYGFAKVSRSIRAEWAPLLEAYLTDRSPLFGVVLLVESRVVTDQDRQTLAWLRSVGHNPLVVATKADKLKPSERVRTLRQTHLDLGLIEGEMLIPYSAVTGDGRERVWGALRDLAKI
ncbi:MAG: ribosome biogenesis GTP-binding protein YihA/YsxC [Nitrospiraceae bacterium]|jgi:GTP-binding protein|uniref:ribosome biogenesis GTP-binding protein YihA/YsxC n=1 Tax=Nitrospira cf. moscoviensis SBR1015 TaxID=96242 RepID=UPI000A0E8576|nr:ribosome biogenesis GTP-binding protein YihA/YsxC [Nitrospira cf. moscoviensis SBR1015]MBY0248224.1 ribosome biogenesis GTP-binding protein YihA/YsxC [Nitrospiraceae bacterium]OQW33290.1 MAG: GTP-binding protein [Nitrospira sp. SG-bin2]